MIVGRVQLLKELESVTPGLAEKEIIEQSDCFVFKDGDVITYNDEICCRRPCCLKIEGVIKPKPLLRFLRGLKQYKIKAQMEDERLKITTSSGDVFRVFCEKEITLPINEIGQPKKWRTLPAEFLEAISLVKDSVGRDETDFVLLCIHIAPDRIEASDHYEVARYKITTGLKQSVQIRADIIKPRTLIEANVIEFRCREIFKHRRGFAWMHFRNKDGLILSCRKYTEDFPDTSKVFAGKGHRLTLSQNLLTPARRAAALALQCSDCDERDILVSLEDNTITIQGSSKEAVFETKRYVEYQGPPTKFWIDCNHFIRVIQRYRECEIMPDRLIVRAGSFTHAFVLRAYRNEDDEQEGTPEKTKETGS